MSGKSLEEVSVREPQEIQEDFLTVETSGSTSDGKTYQFRNGEVDILREGPAELLEKAGFNNNQVVLNGGAPLPHMSGWIYREMFEELGAEVLNSHRGEWPEVFRKRDISEIDVFCTVPLGAVSFADELEEENRDWKEEFSPERVVAGGDFLFDSIRSDLEEEYGAEAYDVYALTEGGIVAIEEEPGEGMVPNSDYDFELLPEEGELVNIEELERETTGNIVLSHPEIDWLTRVKSGDIMSVDPEGPLLHYEGREGDVISMGGAPLYPGQIEETLRKIYGEELEDWKAVARRGKDGFPSVNVYLKGVENVSRSEFIETLPEYSPAVAEALEYGVADMDLNRIEDAEGLEIPEERFKSNRIVKGESYNPVS